MAGSWLVAGRKDAGPWGSISLLRDACKLTVAHILSLRDNFKIANPPPLPTHPPFCINLSTFQAENKPKNRYFNVQSNAYTLPKQLQKNFEKIQNTTFWTPKMAKSRMSTWQKVSLFKSISIYEHLFCLIDTNNKKKSFPLIAKHIFFLQPNLRHLKN